MLLFEADKQKLLEFNPIEAKNVNLDKLQYFLRINLGEGIEFGFPGTMNQETKKVVFTIPALTELVNYDLSEDGYDIRLEVIDPDKKFFSSPWMERVKFKTSPKITMEMTDATVDTKPSLQVKLTEDKDIDVEVVHTKKVVHEHHSLEDVSKDVKLPGWLYKSKKESS